MDFFFNAHQNYQSKARLHWLKNMYLWDTQVHIYVDSVDTYNLLAIRKKNENDLLLSCFAIDASRGCQCVLYTFLWLISPYSTIFGEYVAIWQPMTL